MMDPERVKLVGRELQVELSSAEHSLYFHGLSMLPFLREGDLVIVRPIAWDALRRGDIVTYRRGDKFPTRRAFRKHEGRLSLRCDGWIRTEFHTKADDILGRAEARLRDGRWITISDRAWRYATWRAMARATIRSWNMAFRRWIWAAKRGRR
jgi:hypothetical protein